LRKMASCPSTCPRSQGRARPLQPLAKGPPSLRSDGAHYPSNRSAPISQQAVQSARRRHGRLWLPWRLHAGRFRRCHQTAMRRRHLRAIGRSWDKTRKPSGSIQNPRTGKKPKTPPKMSSAPVAMRAMRERGIGTRSEPRTSLPSL